MQKGMLVKKEGMTQVFDEKGNLVPVTVLIAGPCVVTQKKTMENDGYNALQIGFVDKKDKATTKPEKGHFEKAGVTPKRFVKEFRLENMESFEVGAEIKADLFEVGEMVDVSGTSKGKGYQGAIKRHGFSRGPMAHGSKYHRKAGSMGAASYPGKVFKGKKMAGHMGAEKVSVQNLEIVKIDSEKNLLLVKGSVPGPRGTVLTVIDSVKK